MGDQIGKTYNQYIASVHENLNNLFKSSVDITNLFKTEIAEIRRIVHDTKAESTTVNNGAPKFLKLRPIGDLKEDQNRFEQENELAEHLTQTRKKRKADVEI